MTRKIEIYTGSRWEDLLLLAKEVIGMPREYIAYVSENGYDLTSALRSNGEVMKIRTVGNDHNGNVAHGVKDILAEACYALTKERKIPIENISIVGNPRGLDIVHLAAIVDIMDCDSRPYRKVIPKNDKR